jgi:queuine/archaeosine tRNA-ribosyltransferase
MLAGQLLSLHNLTTFHELLADLRVATGSGRLPELRATRIEAMLGRLEP